MEKELVGEARGQNRLCLRWKILVDIHLLMGMTQEAETLVYRVEETSGTKPTKEKKWDPLAKWRGKIGAETICFSRKEGVECGHKGHACWLIRFHSAKTSVTRFI